MSFNNVGHFITSTFPTLQHFAALNHTSPNYTSLGLEFGPSISLSMQDSWARVTRALRAQGRRVFARNLCLEQRIQYVEQCLYAKIWHVAQIFPLPRAQAQKLKTICSWFFWKGATFRVPMSTLQRAKHKGEWGLPDVEVTC